MSNDTRLLIEQWGDDAAIRLPQSLGMTIGQKVSVIKQGDAIIIQPLEKTVNLADLLAQITPENHHPDVFDAPAGKEIL